VYTGARIGEIIHLEWDGEIELKGGDKAKEVDFERGVAFLFWKIEHGLKTPGSEAPVGLPDRLVEALKEWKRIRTCKWVFPNERHKPWTGGSKGNKHLDQLKEVAKRAGIPHATWKMFRHSFNTHGKQWFGVNREQMRSQLRHEDQQTQEHYDHDDLENLRSAVKAIDFSA
jgi:integrase